MLLDDGGDPSCGWWRASGTPTSVHSGRTPTRYPAPCAPHPAPGIQNPQFCFA